MNFASGNVVRRCSAKTRDAPERSTQSRLRQRELKGAECIRIKALGEERAKLLGEISATGDRT
jgi:hypothetical protein